MNRPHILDFCLRNGIFKHCTSSGVVIFGPYGKLLLEEIKKEWLRANIKKFQHNFLVDSNENLLQKSTHKFESNFLVKSISEVYGIKELPVGLLNIYKSKLTKESSQKFSDQCFLLNNLKNNSMVTYLNAFHFHNNQKINFDASTDIEDTLMKSDPLAFWQRERKNWWIKIFNSPEFVEMIHSGPNKEEDSIDNFHVVYKQNNDSSKDDNDVIATSLESIKHITDLMVNKQFLHSLLNSTDIQSNFLLKDTNQMIVTQTTCEQVLENVLLDSVQYRRMKSDILKKTNPNEKQKIIFRLNFKLAPHKACILYNKPESKDAEAFANEARDLKKLFFYNQIDVLLMPVVSEEELQFKYDHLDEMGVPYSIYLPPGLTKDGMCHVRNRETTLQEHLHISLVVKQFKAISNALSL